MKKDYKKVEASIYNLRFWIKDCEPTELQQRYESYVVEVGFHVVGFNDHHFENQGYTCFWLLAESHLALHSFPESQKTYVELSSCNLDKLKKFQALTVSEVIAHKDLP